MDNMSDGEWIDHFHEGGIESVAVQTIPNTPEMRRLRKKTIEKINEHLMSQHMENQIKMRMNIIQQLKEKLSDEEEKNEKDEKNEKIKKIKKKEKKEKKEKKDKEMEEFFRIRKELQSHFTS